MLGKRDNRHERPYRIDYVRSTRTLYDSARTLEGARARIATRLTKPAHRAELARIYLGGRLIEETCYAKLSTE